MVLNKKTMEREHGLAIKINPTLVRNDKIACLLKYEA